MLYGPHSAQQQQREAPFSIEKLRNLKHRIESSAHASSDLAPVETQWRMNAAGLLDRVHGTHEADTGSKDGANAQSIKGTQTAATPWTSHVVFVIGGGEDARVDALQAVRMGWDLIAFKGTGGLADQLVACMEKHADSGVANRVRDADAADAAVVDRSWYCCW